MNNPHGLRRDKSLTQQACDSLGNMTDDYCSWSGEQIKNHIKAGTDMASIASADGALKTAVDTKMLILRAAALAEQMQRAANLISYNMQQFEKAQNLEAGSTVALRGFENRSRTPNARGTSTSSCSTSAACRDGTSRTCHTPTPGLAKTARRRGPNGGTRAPPARSSRISGEQLETSTMERTQRSADTSRRATP